MSEFYSRAISKWYTTLANTPQFSYPNEIFVRFVARNYYPVSNRLEIRFMELGSGRGADLKFLRQQGFLAWGIDSAPDANADWQEDVSYIGTFHGEFECVYSLNVLCHIESPPYHEIAEALKPRGKFFAILPADNTEADLEGKGFTRLETKESIHSALDNIFSKVDIRPSCYPHRQRNHVNWVIEADK